MSSVEHETWSIERIYPHARGRVFAAWSDPNVKRRWFVGPDGEPDEDLSMNFRSEGPRAPTEPRPPATGTHTMPSSATSSPMNASSPPT